MVYCCNDFEKTFLGNKVPCYLYEVKKTVTLIKKKKLHSDRTETAYEVSWKVGEDWWVLRYLRQIILWAAWQRCSAGLMEEYPVTWQTVVLWLDEQWSEQKHWFWWGGHLHWIRNSGGVVYLLLKTGFKNGGVSICIQHTRGKKDLFLGVDLMEEKYSTVSKKWS